MLSLPYSLSKITTKWHSGNGKHCLRYFSSFIDENCLHCQKISKTITFVFTNCYLLLEMVTQSRRDSNSCFKNLQNLEAVVWRCSVRVCLHVTDTKSHLGWNSFRDEKISLYKWVSSRDLSEFHPGMKKFLYTSEFHLGTIWVEFHPRMKFNLKENIPLSMKTYLKIYHFNLIC